MLKAARIIAWCSAVAITFLTLAPPELRPVSGAPHDLEHFAAFFIMGAAFGVGYFRQALWIAIALVVFAAVLELVQIVVPGRHATVEDFVVDALAVFAGVVLASLIAAPASSRIV